MSMYYKFKIQKQIHGSMSAASSQDKMIYKEFQLPFPPFSGLIITDEQDDEILIEDVYWDTKEDGFHCYTASDKSIYDAIRWKWPVNEVPKMDKLLKEYTDMGWKVIKF